MLPITAAIVALLAILVFSYRQVIDAYRVPMRVRVGGRARVRVASTGSRAPEKISRPNQPT